MSGLRVPVVEVRLDRRSWRDHLAGLTATGLRDDPPWIPPVWFYDRYGSELFERITRLAEYYPTRCERSILAAHAGRIAEVTGAETLVELGSGTSEKTTLLLDALAERGTLRQVVPFDVSEEVLRAAADELAARYPDALVHAVAGDYHEHLDRLPATGSCLLAFLGSTIGNLTPTERSGFLDAVTGVLGHEDWFLLGTDLVKDPERLVAAYDDPGGVTAEFNLNALRVLQRELGADLEPADWQHRAVYDESEERIEMHLVATGATHIRIGHLGVDRTLRAGAWIRTEISTKFRTDALHAELEAAGLGVVGSWTDEAGDFLLTLAQPRGTSAS